MTHVVVVTVKLLRYMQIICTNRITSASYQQSVFTGQRPFLQDNNQQCQSTESVNTPLATKWYAKNIVFTPFS